VLDLTKDITMKKLLSLMSIFAFLTAFSVAKADMNVGLSVMLGQSEVSGSEFENGAGSSDKNSKEIKEIFYGGSVFVEFADDSGFAIGVDYVPVDVEIGDGSRTDTAAVSENDSGTRTASAELQDLITLYVDFPIGSNGYYGTLGYHSVDVTTQETLNSSSYGDESLNGVLIGWGKKSGNFKYALEYSNFDDIELEATGGSATHKIEANADALKFKIAYGF
tara:strand:+ start:413 stop:1075 length:663 start_codon:yes stop_codon:yes gene_type:complete